MIKTIGTVASILIAGWIGWVSVTAMGATPRDDFDEHVTRAQDKYERAQERIEDKLNDIQQTILDLHKGE